MQEQEYPARTHYIPPTDYLGARISVTTMGLKKQFPYPQGFDVIDAHKLVVVKFARELGFSVDFEKIARLSNTSTGYNFKWRKENASALCN